MMAGSAAQALAPTNPGNLGPNAAWGAHSRGVARKSVEKAMTCTSWPPVRVWPRKLVRSVVDVNLAGGHLNPAVAARTGASEPRDFAAAPMRFASVPGPSRVSVPTDIPTGGLIR